MTIISVPSLRNNERGNRLVKKASLTAVLTWDSAQWGLRGLGVKEVRTG